MLKGNPIVDAIADVISVEQIASGEDVRAVDALFVVNALFEAFEPPQRKAPGIAEAPKTRFATFSAAPLRSSGSVWL